MNNSQLWNNVGALSPGRSTFDLSYVKNFTADMGQLIPVMCDEMIPGDVFKFGNQSMIKFQPLVAPIMHEINVFVHYFFVPYRLLWNQNTNNDLSETGDWESFITGGEDGANADVLPRWTPTDTSIGSLWDYLGFPTGINPTGALPIDFPRRAYNLIDYEYYRDQQLQTDPLDWENESIVYRNWEKDYFTSSRPSLTLGTPPALSISGTTNAEFTNVTANATVGGYSNSFRFLTASTDDDFNIYNGTAQEVQNAKDSLSNNTVDLSNASAFDVADLRLTFQIQRWMERNNRAGARYTEFLKSHFGVSPRDSRLQRPEYCGGTKNPVVVSEVLQNSETNTTPQGERAGNAFAVGDSYAGKYRAEEFGLIMGLMSVMPKTAYSQGINRQWLRESKFDFYFPEFANLSEQAITNAEICAKDVDSTHNEGIFGYQGRYDEMRVKQNMVCSNMRSVFDYWHLARQFNPTSAPVLNSDFITADGIRKDIFAVPSEDGLIVQFANIIKAFRPLPVTPEPGLIDHD